MAIFITKKIKRELTAYREIVAPFKNLGISDTDLSKILKPLIHVLYDQMLKETKAEIEKRKYDLESSHKSSGGCCSSSIGAR